MIEHKVKELKLPLQMVQVTQPFGANYVDFYKKLGLKGHNGIDLRIKRGYPVYAMHEGTVEKAGLDGTGGVGVYILKDSIGPSYRSVYYHLLKTLVKKGQKVKAGQKIGLCDNTGKYTTGDHLHVGFKFTAGGVTLNLDNGYRGSVDFSKYLPRNWNKSRCYHRYPTRDQTGGIPRNWWAEFYLRFAPEGIDNVYTRSGRWIHRQLIARGLALSLSGEQINAIIYGGWDFHTVINPAMYQNYGWLTKGEYLKRKRAFLDVL